MSQYSLYGGYAGEQDESDSERITGGLLEAGALQC